MTHLQIGPSARVRSQLQSARYRSQLQAAHAAAIARANAICAREPGVVSIYALGAIIAQIEADQILHGELHQIAEAITLNRVIARLKTLIP